MITDRLDAMDARARAARPHPMSIPVLATDLALSLDVITLVAALRTVLELTQSRQPGFGDKYVPASEIRRAIEEALA